MFTLAIPTQILKNENLRLFRFPWEVKEEEKVEVEVQQEENQNNPKKPGKVKYLFALILVICFLFIWSPWKNDDNNPQQITALTQSDVEWAKTITKEDLDDPETLNKVINLILEMRDKVNYKSLMERLLAMVCEKYPKLCDFMSKNLNFDDVSVEELDLPEKIQKALERNWIYTIGALKQAIRDAQDEAKKSGKQEWEPFLKKRIKGVGGDVVSQIIQALRGGGITVEGVIKGDPKGRLKNYLPNSERLDKLNLSEKAINGLKVNGIKTVQSLMKFIIRCIHEGKNWKDEIQKFPGVSKGVSDQIAYRLQYRKLLNKDFRPKNLKPVPVVGTTSITRENIGDNRLYNFLKYKIETVEQLKEQYEKDPQWFFEQYGFGDSMHQKLKKIVESK